ncbi:MAG: hypothetical protein JO199_10450 [Candidatus Eremiobacteraeota bacterium]|nr:hypothetical protein [Candidatus Eremiobacteraeota bacterium]
MPGSFFLLFGLLHLYVGSASNASGPYLLERTVPSRPHHEAWTIGSDAWGNLYVLDYAWGNSVTSAIDVYPRDGNVFVRNQGPCTIAEYPHGGTNLLRTLKAECSQYWSMATDARRNLYALDTAQRGTLYVLTQGPKNGNRGTVEILPAATAWAQRSTLSLPFVPFVMAVGP